MRIGISTATFFGKAPTEAAFDILRQMRVDTTEVFLNTFCEYEKPFVDGLAARRGNINVHSVHALGTQYEPELYNSNARVRNDAEIIFRKVCYAGHVLGAKFVTFHGPLKIGQYLPYDFVKLGDRTNQLIDIAASYGLRLSYENVHYCYFSEPNFYAQLLKQCPRLCATLDLKQALIADYDPISFLNTIESSISTIHICDYFKKQTCVPGKGKYNFEKFFKELDKRNIQVPILLEVYAKDYADMNALKESYNYLNSCLIKVLNS